MKPDNFVHLDVCQNIEFGLRVEYDALPELTDGLCVIGLDNSIIALKQKFGFARNETVRHHPAIDGIVALVVDVGVEHIDEVDGLTLKEFISLIHDVKKSVLRHSAFGARGYYDFIKNFV